MILHRPLDLTTWDHITQDRQPTPFTIGWSTALALLQREADQLTGRKATTVYVEVDLPPSAIRVDGQMRSDAPRRIATPAVAVELPGPDGAPIRFTSDHHRDNYASRYLAGWQSNVYAVAKTLEALRAMDRWGATSGEQYRGFAALPSTSSGMALGTGLTPDDAMGLLWNAADRVPPLKVSDVNADDVARAYRVAARTHHPDQGGDPGVFAKLGEARDILLRAVR